MYYIEINGKDAFKEWGLKLSEKAFTELLTPAPVKEYIISESRIENGQRVFLPTDINGNELGRVNSREVTIPVHITAHSEEEFLLRYAAFSGELSKGRINLRVPSLGMTFRFYFLSCTQYSMFFGAFACFALKFVEPDPTDRGEIGKSESV